MKLSEQIQSEINLTASYLLHLSLQSIQYSNYQTNIGPTKSIYQGPIEMSTFSQTSSQQPGLASSNNPQESSLNQPQNLQESPSERTFKCKCKKIYKSYPALYTHIKNKHPDQIRQYKEESQKPKDGETEKGRPKKHKDRPQEAEDQGDLLNIIELGILKIEEHLSRKSRIQHGRVQGNSKNANNEMFEILQGNTRLQFEQLQEAYHQEKTAILNIFSDILQKTQAQTKQFDNSNLSDCPVDVIKQLESDLQSRNLSQLSEEKPVRVYKENIRFKNELIQHFNSTTASKILIQMELFQIEDKLSSKRVTAALPVINFRSRSSNLLDAMEQSQQQNSFNHGNLEQGQSASELNNCNADQKNTGDQIKHHIRAVKQLLFNQIALPFWKNDTRMVEILREVFEEWHSKLRNVTVTLLESEE